MEQFILQLGNMSLQASIVIGVVLLVRILFAKLGIAKKYINILWILPYLCMVCPWKLEGDFGFWRQYESSVIDSTFEGIEDIMTEGNTNITHAAIDGNAFTGALDNMAQNVTDSQVSYVSGMDVMQLLLTLCGIVWLAGIIGLLIYSADAHLKLHKKLICCIHLSENIYLADDIAVPFVMGLRKPRIYLPSHMPMEGLDYVIAHEKTHIQRRDPLKKMLAYIITCLHWFNPLAWAAFYFFGKDMEMACDEETVLGLGISHKQDYATVLLSLSSGKKLFLGAPLAFGEGNVKGRIKNIVKYKKTWRVLSVLAVAVIVVLTVGFMTKETVYVPLSEVQDMVHPPREATTVVITINGESKELSAEKDFEQISNFLRNMEIEKDKKSLSRSEDRPMDIVVELGVQRFCFTADYGTIWSDNDVKPSFSHQVKEPEKVRNFVEAIFAEAPAVEEIAQPVTEIVPDIEALAGMEPHELTMEELLELYNNGTLKEVMAALPFVEKSVYTNLEKQNIADSNALNYFYACDLEYDGEMYLFRVSYYRPEKAEGRDFEANQMDMVYLTHKASGDMCTLYVDRDPAFSAELEAFLELEYNIEQYLTFELPKGTWLGEYKVGINDIYDGCLILGDYEELPHSMAEAWVSPGSIGITPHVNMGEGSYIMKFEQGKPISVQWHTNHAGFITKGEYLDGCDMPAILYEAEFDLFTAADSIEYAEKHNIPEGELQTVSKYYYVFFGKEDSSYIYYVALNQAYFNKEDIIALARSVKFTVQ